MKRFVTLLLCVSILFIMLSAVCYAKEFPDVPLDHWAFKYIDELSNQSVINGYNDGTYKPSGTVKRSEFIKLVMASCWPSYLDLDEVGHTIDHWAGPYIKLAEINSIVMQGEYNLENIEQPITRIEMARIVANADIIMNYTPSQFSETLPFIDVGNVDLRDKYLLSHTIARGLITGYEDKTFRPEKTMTRAEAATMIWRFTNLDKEVIE